MGPGEDEKMHPLIFYLDVSKNRWYPKNGWFMMENPIKMDDLGVPLFLETPICIPWESVTFIFRGYIYI